MWDRIRSKNDVDFREEECVPSFSALRILLLVLSRF